MARPLDSDVVFDAVCEWLRVRPGDVLDTNKRTGRVSKARTFISHILHADGMTTGEIADACGMSDGSSARFHLRQQLPGGDLESIMNFVKEKCNVEN